MKRTQIFSVFCSVYIISVSSRMKQYNGRLISPQSMLSDDTNTHFRDAKGIVPEKMSVMMSLMGCLT